MRVEVVSPDAIQYQGEAEMVVCSTVDGDIAFLPGHEPFVGLLRIAKVRCVGPESVQVIAVHRGFVETNGHQVTVLSDIAELPDEIDRVRAVAAKDQAQAALRDNPDDEVARDALARAELRLSVTAL